MSGLKVVFTFSIAYKPWTSKSKPHRYYAIGKLETVVWMPLAFGLWVRLRADSHA